MLRVVLIRVALSVVRVIREDYMCVINRTHHCDLVMTDIIVVDIIVVDSIVVDGAIHYVR